MTKRMMLFGGASRPRLCENAVRSGRVSDGSDADICKTRFRCIGSRQKGFLSPDCRHKRSGSEDLHCSFHVVGKFMQAHLGTHSRQCLGQEVRRSHPRLEGTERILGGLSSSLEARGVRLSRFCMVSSTSSCSHRAMRRFSPLVHCDVMGQRGQADDQYLWIVNPSST